MGYRSEVKICLKKSDAEELKKRLQKFDYMLKEDCYTENYMEAVDRIYPEDTIIMGWDCIKWYNGFEDIDTVEDFLNELDEQDKEYSFIRIGEEYDDIETRSNYGDGSCARLSVSRYIDID